MADGTVIIKVDDNAVSAASHFTKLNTSLRATSTQGVKTAKATNALKTSTSGLSTAVKGLATVYAAVKIKDFTVSLVNAASEAQETENKFNVTFSSIQEKAQKTAETLSESFGLSSQASQQLLSDTGDLLSGFEFTQEEALDLSTQVNKLAVDLASFTNYAGGAEGASAALTKALLGERESIKSLGIAIMEADIKQLADDKGITGALTRQQKAVLTLELALRQSKNAVGDFARSEKQYANQSRILKGNIDDLKVSLGNELLPVWTDYIKQINLYIKNDGNDLINNFKTTMKSANALLQVIQALGTTLYEAGKIAGETGVAIYNAFKNPKAALKGLDEAYTESFGNIKTSAKEAVDAIAELEKEENKQANIKTNSTVSKTAKTNVDNNIEETATAWETFKKEFQGDSDDMGSAIEDKIGGAFSSILADGKVTFNELASTVLNIFSDVASSLISSGISLAIKTAFGSVTPSANGNVFSGGNVQAFANGGSFTNGIVDKPTYFPMANGGTGLMGEKDPEGILPLDKINGKLGVNASGLGGSNVNVYNQSNSQIQTIQRPDNQLDIIIKQTRSIMASEGSKGAFSTALQRQQTSGVQGA